MTKSDLVSTPDLGELRSLLARRDDLAEEWNRRSLARQSLSGTAMVRDALNRAIAEAITPALLDNLEAAREEIATLTAQRDRAERRHERLELGVTRYAAALRADCDHECQAPAIMAELLALLAEGAASEEGA